MVLTQGGGDYSLTIDGIPLQQVISSRTKSDITITRIAVSRVMKSD